MQSERGSVIDAQLEWRGLTIQRFKTDPVTGIVEPLSFMEVMDYFEKERLDRWQRQVDRDLWRSYFIERTKEE